MIYKYGAEGGTRTPTSNCSLDPEPSASTNSATSAYAIEEKKHALRVKKKVISNQLQSYFGFNDI